jgi:outer membrane protein OmpA-like peptidoglycan-associated protein
MGVMYNPRALALVITFVLPGLAAADGLDGDRFKPSVGAEGTFAVEHPSVAAHLDWGVGLFLNYARDPIVVRDGDDITQNVLDRTVTADLVGSFGLFGWGELGFGLPLHLVYDGDGYANGAAVLAPDEGVGDLRVVPKFALIRDVRPTQRLQLGIGVPVTFPTGDAEAARGAGGFTVTPELLFAFHRSGIGIGFDLGYKFREVHPADLPYGDAIVIEPWLAYAATDQLTLRAELLAEKQVDAAIQGADFPIEIIGGLDYRIGSVDLFAGGSAGLTDGVGAPTFRIIGGIRYRYYGDGGGRGDYYTGGDPDGDGVRGRRDRCPDRAEDDDGFEDWDGCPEDDNDRDGIADDDDECPEMPGDRAHDGCPARTYVKIVDGKIYIFGKVQFATGSARVDNRSEVVLDQVAAALRANPQVRHVRIDGHTDNIGGPTVNRRLAGERAAAVKAGLQRRGISGGRLSTRGVGEDNPIAPNRTRAGRAKNRRVEFIITGGR